MTLSISFKSTRSQHCVDVGDCARTTFYIRLDRIFRDVFQRLAMIKAQFLIMGPLQSEIRLKITSQVRPILISRKIMIFGLMLRMGTAFILLTVQPFRLTRYSV